MLLAAVVFIFINNIKRIESGSRERADEDVEASFYPRTHTRYRGIGAQTFFEKLYMNRKLNPDLHLYKLCPLGLSSNEIYLKQRRKESLT